MYQERFPKQKQLENNEGRFLTGFPSAGPNSQCVELEQMKPPRPTKNLEVAKKKEEPPSVAYYKLYSFADTYDVLLIFLGTAGACMHGVAIPVFFIFFGKLIDAFGTYYNDPETMSKEVSKVHISFRSLSFLRKRIGFTAACELLLNNSRSLSAPESLMDIGCH